MSNTVKATIEDVEILLQEIGFVGGAFVASDHNSLGGRSASNTHPATSISADTTNFDGNLSAADNTVQKALETLDELSSSVKAFFAENFDNPNNPDLAVNSLAKATPDSNNNGIVVRVFDDTGEEGIGFSVNIPSENPIVETDYVGLVSGKKTDKSDLFEIFNGELENAPMIAQCAINMECRLYDTYDTPHPRPIYRRDSGSLCLVSPLGLRSRGFLTGLSGK